MNLRKVVTALIFVALTVLAVSFFWKKEIVLILILVGLAFLLQKLSPIRGFITCFIVIGVLGPVAESAMIWLGKGPWIYSLPFFFNVPLWLFPLYGMSGIIFISLYQGLIKPK